MYQVGEALILPPELADYALEQQQNFTEDDPRAGEVAEFLDRPLPEDWEKKDKAARQLCGINRLYSVMRSKHLCTP